MDIVEQRLREILNRKDEITQAECVALGVVFPLGQDWREVILAAVRRRANSARQEAQVEKRASMKARRRAKKAKRKDRPNVQAAAPKPKPKRNRKAKGNFYSTWEWKALRYETLKRYGHRCMCCGWSPEHGGANYLVVDHIKPRSKYPELELDPSNMQCLCNQCNQGKSNKHEDDFRGFAPIPDGERIPVLSAMARDF